MEKLPDLPGAVDARGVVVFLRHLLEARQEYDHGRSELPDGQENQGGERVLRRGNPGGRRYLEEALQDGVYHAVPGEEPAPKDGDGYRAAEQGGEVEEG